MLSRRRLQDQTTSKGKSKGSAAASAPATRDLLVMCDGNVDHIFDDERSDENSDQIHDCSLVAAQLVEVPLGRLEIVFSPPAGGAGKLEEIFGNSSWA